MESQKNKQAFWNSYSERFNAIYGTKNTPVNLVINKLFRRSMKLRFIETIKRIPSNASSVLDIGCGPGHFSIEVAKNMITKVHGIDFSKDMIDLAIINSKKVDLKNNLDFTVCDFNDLKSETKYEYTIMMGFIEYFDNPYDIVKKAIDISSKKVFISFPKSGGLLAWQRQIRYKKRCYLKLYSQKEIDNLMSRFTISSYTIESAARDYFVTINI